MTSQSGGTSDVAPEKDDLQPVGPLAGELDSAFVARLRSSLAANRVGAAARLFRLQIPVPREVAADEFGAEAVESLVRARFVETAASELRPLVSLSTFSDLLIASDLLHTADQRDHVLGVGPATQALARLTIRRRISAALDLGTGSGVQALLAAAHADHVVGVDVSARALTFARRNAALNGVENVEWRLGNWLEPVGGERFALVIANPPYVVSPDNALAYRDSGDENDSLVRRLLAHLTGALAEGGYAQVLCDWVPRRGGDWRGPLEESIVGRGCDAILFEYGEMDAGVYAARWNRRLALTDRSAFAAAVERWTAHYRRAGIESIAFGIVVLRRRKDSPNWIRAFEVPARATEGAGDHLVRLFEGHDWARSASDRVVLETAFEPGQGTRIVERLEAAGDGGFERGRMTLETRPNVGFAARIDPTVARIVRRCNGRLTSGELLADETPETRGQVAAELKRLVGMGFLTPAATRQKIDRGGPSRLHSTGSPDDGHQPEEQ